jgi:hypothetical protein
MASELAKSKHRRGTGGTPWKIREGSAAMTAAVDR